MRIAVLGTGTVGKAIASKLVALGHEVTMGSRSADNEAAVAWAEHAGEGDAATGAELVFNCTAGAGSLEARATGAGNLADKTLVDVATKGLLAGHAALAVRHGHR